MIAEKNHSPGSVLIVESSGETSEVLRTILEPRGLRVLSTTEASDGLTLLREHQPNVTILDVESQTEDARLLCSQYDAEAGRSLVVLGKVPGTFKRKPRGRIVAKPYHYAPLIHTIEELVEQSYAKADCVSPQTSSKHRRAA